LFLVLARVAHQGSRLSALRWAEDQAVGEVLGLGKFDFDEDDLYAALDDLAARQERIEKRLGTCQEFCVREILSSLSNRDRKVALN
jgi:hypothetical protein